MGLKAPSVKNHIAVHLNHYIVVIGGQYKEYCIWTYHLVTECWKKHWSPKGQVPEILTGACAVNIDGDIYIFGGRTFSDKRTNNTWKLTHKVGSKFVWCLISEQQKKPSPRATHSGWEYDSKMWVFGGKGPVLKDCLNTYGEFHLERYNMHYNNQLLQFDPANKAWTDVKCFGEVPTPRYKHATTASTHNVWLFGGKPGEISDGLYELDMRSCIWTKVQTVMLEPQSPRYSCSLNVTAGNKLVLHGGIAAYNGAEFRDTWIMDISSNSWRVKTSEDDHKRYCHTGSQGFGNSIIIIGGGASKVEGWSCTHQIMLEPKTLQQLAIKTLHKHQMKKSKLRACMQLLPRKLKELIDIA